MDDRAIASGVAMFGGTVSDTPVQPALRSCIVLGIFGLDLQELRRAAPSLGRLRGVERVAKDSLRDEDRGQAPQDLLAQPRTSSNMLWTLDRGCSSSNPTLSSPRGTHSLAA